MVGNWQKSFNENVEYGENRIPIYHQTTYLSKIKSVLKTMEIYL